MLKSSTLLIRKVWAQTIVINFQAGADPHHPIEVLTLTWFKSDEIAFAMLCLTESIGAYEKMQKAYAKKL